MRTAPIFILIAAGSLSGCLGSEYSMEETPENQVDAHFNTKTANQTLISSYWMKVEYGADIYAPEGVCDAPFPEPIGTFKGKYYLGRTAGDVTLNHTELLLDIRIENDFSDIGASGFRILAYYNHTLVFATESLMESVQISYPLDESQVDLDEDRRWTFFYKRTDPLTADDPDACTSGQQSGEIEFKIYAM